MGRINLGGGINTSDATAVASDIKVGKTAYVNKEKIIGTSEAVDMNHIIEEYKVKTGENINIKDFVEFANEYNIDSELTTISTGTTGNYPTSRKWLQISNNSFLFLSSGSGTIYTLNSDGKTFNMGVTTTINSTSVAFDAVQLSNDRILIIHTEGLYGTLIKVQNDTITVLSDASIKLINRKFTLF